MRRFAPQLFAHIFCMPLMIISVSNSQGQSPTNRTISQERVQNLERLVGSIRTDLNQYQRQKQQAQLSLRDDFRKLQVVNNDLMRRMFVHSSFVTREISQKEVRLSLCQIQKLAKRLSLGLAIPEVKASKVPDTVALSPGLLLLDKAVMSFVENPLFEQPRVFDAEMASRAGRDLSEILRLSKFLSKLAKED